jgi:hypothetical protein
MTHYLADLPEPVLQLLRGSVRCEFATVSSAGVPIDTPMVFFPTLDLRSLDVATGLAYPSKAERARKNPKVGLLLKGAPWEPVIAIAGRAAVRDTNLQSNTDRYLVETAFSRIGLAPWPLARKAVWYWTRIIVSIAPARILWWDSPAAMDRPPREWRVPAGSKFPESDPAPPGALSAAPNWPHQHSWREQARGQLAGVLPAHLTLCDDEGYPLPIRAQNVRLIDDGFYLEVPKGAAPWSPAGKATLTFAGVSTFVGDVTSKDGQIHLRVERALPILPFVAEAKELWEPSPSTYETIMGRLNHEAARRGQPIPKVPEEEPEPSPAAKLRIAHLAAVKERKTREKIDLARMTVASEQQRGRS